MVKAGKILTMDISLIKPLTENDLIFSFMECPIGSLDLETINYRRTTLLVLGYNDFTRTATRSAWKEYKDYNYQGEGWITYCQTCPNLHLLIDEEFEGEIASLPEKEELAQAKFDLWVGAAKVKESMEQFKNINRIEFEKYDFNLSAAMIPTIEGIINSNPMKSGKYKSMWDYVIKQMKEINLPNDEIMV